MIRRRDEGVVLEGMTPETTDALLRCGGIFSQHGLTAVVTSGRDSHASGLHPTGRAFDLRLPSRLVFEQVLRTPWDKKERDFDQRVALEIRAALGENFDVILERHQSNQWAWHIHVEYDPR